MQLEKVQGSGSETFREILSLICLRSFKKNHFSFYPFRIDPKRTTIVIQIAIGNEILYTELIFKGTQIIY